MSAIHVGPFANPFRSHKKSEAPPPPLASTPPSAAPLRSPVEDTNYWAYHASFDNTTLVVNRAQPYERVRFYHASQTTRAEAQDGSAAPGHYAYDESVMALANAAVTREQQPFLSLAGGVR